MTEKEKYEGIYNSLDSPLGQAQYSGYRHTFHGKSAIPIISLKKINSLIDVGCGHNEFCKHMRKLGVKAVGVDFACKNADLIADAKQLPFENKAFDFVTAFDMLEHLKIDEVPIVLTEFARVSRNFVFSISYRDSVYKWKGETLHPTVKPENWWIEQITSHGGHNISKQNRYLLGEWR